MIDRKELAPLLALMVVFASLVAVAAVNVTSDSGDGNIFFKGYERKFGEDIESIFAEYIGNIGTITESTIEVGRLIAA